VQDVLLRFNAALESRIVEHWTDRRQVDEYDNPPILQLCGRMASSLPVVDEAARDGESA